MRARRAQAPAGGAEAVLHALRPEPLGRTEHRSVTHGNYITMAGDDPYEITM